jgi:hypothetical protein
MFTALPGSCQSVPCIQRHDELLREFAQVLDEYHRMQKVQLAAILNGEDFPFEEWIAKAATRMMQAKNALLEDRQEHRCLQTPVRSDR